MMTMACAGECLQDVRGFTKLSPVFAQICVATASSSTAMQRLTSSMRRYARAHATLTRNLSTASTPAASTAASAASPAASLSMASTLRMRSGHGMPVVGLGTWRAPAGEVGSAVSAALEAGYRHIDCAAVYANETEVGQALSKWASSTGNKKDSVFITSKLWNTFHAPEHVEPALRRSLQALQLKQLDLYLIHWPASFRYTPPDAVTGAFEFYPRERNGHTLFAEPDIPLADTWTAMLECKRKGLVRDVGVSNCTSEQVAELSKKFGQDEAPSVNQIECHPLCPQREMQRRIEPLGTHIVAYSPLGNIHAAPPSAGIRASAAAPGSAPPPPSPLHSPAVASIARSHNVTPAQVLLRWNLQLGRAVLAKSVHAERIRSNADLFGFTLNAADMDHLAQLALPGSQYRFLNPSSFKVQPREYFFTAFE